MAVDCFYFGCWERPGHYLFSHSMHHVREGELPPDFPVRPDILDGGLLRCDKEQVEGLAVLSWIGDWTVISFWDRSVDRRGNCNSNFVMRGKLPFDAAVALAKEVFPSIWKRFTFEVTLRTSLGESGER